MSDTDIARKIYSDYTVRFPRSKEYHTKLMNFMPGGTTRSLSYHDPYPLHIDYGDKAFVYTHEGYQLLDITNSYGANILGHGDPDILEAVTNSVKKGIQFSAPTEAQYDLSKLLCNRIPSFEKVRFCNSGTEATLFAIRTARACTQRNKIIRMSGGFHGTHDSVASSTKQNLRSFGVPSGMTEDVIEIPFNDPETLEQTIKQFRSELACVIIEPFLGAGGIILPDKGYLKFVRNITENNDVLLIFDEIFSYRIDIGGAQSLYNVTPDLTTLGKVVGGGFPIGVFGGKDELMKIYCQVRTKTPLYHSGTFNGYEVAMRAGLVALIKYDNNAVQLLNSKGDLLAKLLRESIQRSGFRIAVNQLGSYLNLHFVNEKVRTSELAMKSEEELLTLLHLSLLNKGFFGTPRALYVLSVPMTEMDIHNLAIAIDESLNELRPLVIEKYPHLLL